MANLPGTVPGLFAPAVPPVLLPIHYGGVRQAGTIANFEESFDVHPKQPTTPVAPAPESFVPTVGWGRQFHTLLDLPPDQTWIALLKHLVAANLPSGARSHHNWVLHVPFRLEIPLRAGSMATGGELLPQHFRRGGGCCNDSTIGRRPFGNYRETHPYGWITGHCTWWGVNDT